MLHRMGALAGADDFKSSKTTSLIAGTWSKPTSCGVQQQRFYCSPENRGQPIRPGPGSPARGSQFVIWVASQPTGILTGTDYHIPATDPSRRIIPRHPEDGE
ncbi:hypothetical protein MGYG_00227 [Nannizzia gypsea CBS 118893]|uniref:Uncharacterized protein n=1 Tax=Arthroderma gypseum (strain ATCC MYA-4604 / CBS 118893) TaxID=535722 RepID=E5QY92_ARTGP|nr:hypothetical protein MGYG_00227 [Nannizzia gypsea CBS 118893]EFQ97184.1 hypothetical protein MGYG_00227 [Nannizzia gypsea CBS 118893]